MEAMKRSYYPLLAFCCLLLLTPSLLLSQQEANLAQEANMTRETNIVQEANIVQEVNMAKEVKTAATSGDSNTARSEALPMSKLPIGSISTAGNVSISNDKILSKIRSRAGQQFDAATAAEDAKRIAELAGVEYSYYNTTVIDNKIKLTFVIVERNIVRSIVFKGNIKYLSKTLTSKLPFKKADYLEPAMAEAGRVTIADFYRGKGFAFVQVSLDTEELSKGNVVYTVNEGPKVKIAAVGFSGNKTLKTNMLKKVIKTDRTQWVFFQTYYTEEKISKDVTKLQNVYYNHGFLNVKITAGKEFTEDKSKVRITFEIDEGHAYTVDKIAIAGNEHFNTERLWSELKLKQGQTYNKQKADSDTEQLLKLYREDGFINAKVEQDLKFISEDKVDIDFKITEGERFRIGRINITGNEQIQDRAVRLVLDEHKFMPGRWYNADIARGDGSGELEKEVKRMVVAESATITPRGETAGQRDADVSIIEGQTGMVMLGAGVTSDNGLIGQLIFEQKDFDINNRPKSFSDLVTGQAFKGAGQNLRISLQPGTKVSEYSVDFSEPYFQGKPISLDVVGSSWKRAQECYDEGRLKGYVGFEKRYEDHWTRSLGLRVENVDITSIKSTAPKEIKDVEGNNLLMGARFGVGRDLTNDKLNPTKGHSFEVGYEQVGGDYTFGVLSGIYKRYQVLSEDLAERKTILATKLVATSVVIGDAPPFEKFYTGGTGTYGMRGFAYRGVSTRAGVKNDPIGSNWMFLASTEAVVPLSSDTFSALFFADSGMIDTGGYRAAVGTGLQILIPQWFGPVPMRLELAAPVMKSKKDKTQIFSFSVGRLF
jgi:outer membrane protein insertion porin family